MRITDPSQLTKLQATVLAEQKTRPKTIRVCCGTGCLANGAQQVSDAFRKIIEDRAVHGYTVEDIKETGCHGFCEQGPLVIIDPEGTFYTHVKPKDVETI